MQICLDCFSLNTQRTDSVIICKKCLHKQTTRAYSSSQRKAKDAVRYGYLYRVKYENDKKRKIDGRHYSLIDLHKIFDFFATAVISGIAGNWAYDKIKNIFKKLGKNPVIIEIEDQKLQSFLKSEKQQEKFIKYIQEYRNQKIKKVKKVKAQKNVRGIKKKS